MAEIRGLLNCRREKSNRKRRSKLRQIKNCRSKSKFRWWTTLPLAFLKIRLAEEKTVFDRAILGTGMFTLFAPTNEAFAAAIDPETFSKSFEKIYCIISSKKNPPILSRPLPISFPAISSADCAHFAGWAVIKLCEISFVFAQVLRQLNFNCWDTIWTEIGLT